MGISLVGTFLIVSGVCTFLFQPDIHTKPTARIARSSSYQVLARLMLFTLVLKSLQHGFIVFSKYNKNKSGDFFFCAVFHLNIMQITFHNKNIKIYDILCSFITLGIH